VGDHHVGIVGPRCLGCCDADNSDGDGRRGHWVQFTSRWPLSVEQWSVVETYATFSAAELAVYATHSVAPLAPAVWPQSKVVAAFTRDLATGADPEVLYISAMVERVSISGCRARLTLALSHPGGRRVHYVSSWVRPFDRADVSHRGPAGRDRAGHPERPSDGPVRAMAIRW
jgi:hypothetical protein